MEIFKLQGEKRENFGKKGAKQARYNETIPCVLYGGEESSFFAVKPMEIKDLVYNHTFKLVEINLEGKKTKAILKDIQFHPVTDNILHIDFQELVDGRKIKVSVPVIYTGASKGVKEGGALMPLMRKVIIKTTPEKLVDNIKADISSLGLGQSIRVKSLISPEGVQVMHDENTPLAFIEIPRSLKSAKDAATKTGK
ncbi:MAG: 50S ribosomal protein L25 [Saprospiraceae bacterium]|nr:50S ribosomal protein L25 [Saprospiraceae bacterium]